ncbi:Major facilitator superfamily domain, general substrate transporter [Akanthomyces lecanii RCEF 1005]|uniref:Major facilitator superfamily domain, general substrate transporter n=1 Tax=Akanthomyces lecanii RCEF 1005 TaxID=1081108 RepID=A0A168IBV2_CORDF|nr:Major facilitator superfamily domain, general substrate transporter [Akanthomyces lecanii RCEF 1005]
MSVEGIPTTPPVAFRTYIDYQRSLPPTLHRKAPTESCNEEEKCHSSVNAEEQSQHTESSCATVISDERSQRHDSTASTLVVEDPDDRPYSTFSGFQKKNIIVMASVAAFLSPLSSQIYLPATQKIALEYGVSSTKVNLTMTVFIIMQGIVPSFVAAFADNFGRRPVYLVCFPIYIAANIGLALQRHYGALVALRCLQGIGSSAMATLSTAIVADMITSAERGTYMGFTQIGSILGPAIGPVLGGVISQYTDWHYIFWLLAGLACAIFVPLLILLPETCRRMFHRLYQVNEMQTSLIYIPLSLGTLISAATTGQLVNWNFKRYALKHGYPLTSNRQHNLDGFPVERARLEIAWPLMLIAAASLILYGWIMHLNISMAAPVVILFVFGYTNVAAYKTTGILLVDIHPGRAATTR